MLRLTWKAGCNVPSQPRKKKKSGSKGAKIPEPGTYSQDVLDEMLALSPSSAFGSVADILNPPAGEASSYAEWIKENLPHIFTIPFGPHQRWVLDQFQVRPHGLRAYLGAPRGSGKTALSIVGIPLAAIAMGTHEFVVILRNTQSEAEAALDIIRSEIESNPELTQRWPQLKYVKKPKSTKRHRVDTRKEIMLEGGRILAAGTGSKIRGTIRWRTDGVPVRPDLVIMDDIDEDQQARSEMQTNRLEEWIFAQVVSLGSARRPLSVLGIGTTITDGAVATRAIRNKGRFKNWKTERFPALIIDEQGNRRPMWPEGLPMPYLRGLTDPESEEYIGPFTFAREFMLDPQDVIGALWTEALLLKARHEGPRPKFKKLVVAIDPSWGTKGDECGIVVAGLGFDNFGYVLTDLSGRMPPQEWARRAAKAFVEEGADRIVSEAAFGSENVKLVMQQVAPTLPFSVIPANKTADKGNSTSAKARRFEPVRVLYEQGKVKHVGYFPELEKQMVEWTEESHFSPDRIDALAYAIHWLMLGAQSVPAEIYTPVGLRIPDQSPRLRLIGGTESMVV